MNKLTIVLLFAVIALSTQTAAKNQAQLSMGSDLKSMKQQFAKMEGTPLGDMISALVQVHTQVGGPIEELGQALQDFVDDIEGKYQSAQSEFEVESIRHSNAVMDWTNKISVERGTWEDSDSLLNTLYYPNRDALDSDISSLSDSITSNKEDWEEENQDRTDEFNLFVQQSGETSDAIAALSEAIGVVETLKNTEAPSLIQIKRVKASLDKLKVAVRKMKIVGPMIATLMQLAQNFSDQAAVEKILSLLNDMLDNATGFLQELTSYEADSAAAWVSRSAELKAALANYEDLLATAEQSKVENDANIAFQEDRRDTAQAAWNDYSANLQSENDTYDQTTATYEDLMAEFQSEANLFIEAISILQAAGSQIREGTFEEWNSD